MLPAGIEYRPDHPHSPYASLPLAEGTNQVPIRIRGGRYASGGFFAAVKTRQVDATSHQ